MTSTHRPRVFLDVNIGEQPAGRLTIELFTDKTPRTCENFRQICTREHGTLSYEKSSFHRVIDEFMIQGGDITKGDGTGIVSIYGEEFEDENLHWRKMDAEGLVCSANRGKDTNGSQFFITLEPCEHLNGKHTIFGHLKSGQSVLQQIAKVDVDSDDRPLQPVLISRCGELERPTKKAAPAPEKLPPAASRDRGRRRGDDGSDVEMENSPEPRRPTKHHHRRQSDNTVDEGLRGRPRQRSGARSTSRSRSHERKESESSDVSSPAKKHKRKRSSSPSRHNDHPSHERRRRSLPNQYSATRHAKEDGDGGRLRPSARHDEHRDGGTRQDYERARADDRYRPSKDRYPRGDDGRLGGGGHDEHEPPVKFKGRGVMKYREPDRQW